MKIFICTNDNQMIGAKVAKNTIINRSQFSSNDVVILSESEIPSLKRFFMKPYLRWGKMVEFNKNDMQLEFHALDYIIHIVFLVNVLFQIIYGNQEINHLHILH